MSVTARACSGTDLELGHLELVAVRQVNVPGKFAYFSSRNNNFSNRDQTGVVCVKGTRTDGTYESCALDRSTGVLQVRSSPQSNATFFVFEPCVRC